MMPEYVVYLKTPEGKRGACLNDVTSIDITLRWNTVTKWTLTGSGLSACPIGKGDEIVIFRAEEPYLSGFVTAIEDSFDAKTGIYDWTVDGEDDLGKLSRRVIYPDPASDTVQPPDSTYSDTGYFSDVLLNVIRRNAGSGADLSPRRMKTLAAASPEHLGETVTVSSDYGVLLDFIMEQISDGAFGIRSVWDAASGVSTVEIYRPNDVSSTVVFSVEAGSLSGWSRKRTAPKANVILAVGQEIEDAEGTGTGVWQTAAVMDSDSIKAWGRRELYVKHSDIRRIVEKDESGTVIYEEPWSGVQERLEQAALNDLITNAGQDGYELDIVELDLMSYRKHWDLGDIVTVRIADVEMTAPIMEIKVSYSGGIETVKPAVGELRKGELESVFDRLGSLQKSVNILQSA